MGDKLLIRSSFHGEAITDTTMKTNNRNCWIGGSNIPTRKSRKCIIPVVCVKLGKLYVFKHNCVT